MYIYIYNIDILQDIYRFNGYPSDTIYDDTGAVLTWNVREYEDWWENNRWCIKDRIWLIGPCETWQWF